MSWLKRVLGRLLKRERGIEIVEWALVALLFAIVAGPLFSLLNPPVQAAIDVVRTALTQGS